jgi:arylsulfatase A-like enzyme
MIESVDRGIGRIIETLEQTGLRDRTVILFTSDNGGYGPATSMRPLKGYKGTYYEGGIREPFFVNWPGVVEAGTTCDIPIINVDLYPTLCEITGAPLPSGQPIDGISLMPLLRGETADWGDRAIYWHFPAYLQSYQRIDGQRDPLFRSRPCSIIRQGRWKLHEYFEDGELELYDLIADPGEKNNLVRTRPEKANQLHEQLMAWRQSTGAPVPTEANPNYDPAAEAAAMKRPRNKNR